MITLLGVRQSVESRVMSRFRTWVNESTMVLLTEIES